MNKFVFIFGVLLIVFAISCSNSAQKINDQPEPKTVNLVEQEPKPILNPEGQTIATRFDLPEGYERISIEENSYAEYLRTLPLKADGTEVKYYDGSIKSNNSIYSAVVNMDLDARDLQQCADAVMRLRGEYLFEQKRFDDIHFNYLSDRKPRYFKTLSGGKTTYKAFRKYMIQIFSYANTSSLHDEMQPVADMRDMQIGDILIQKGNPYGHAVIVVDMAENKSTGELICLYAQSYMPAQDTQILLNPNDRDLLVWYPVKKGTINTPEWTFVSSDLRRFKDE